MNCPDCGEKMVLFKTGASPSFINNVKSFEDKMGVSHFHDPIQVTKYFRCKNNHHGSIRGFPPCPAGSYCKYGRETEGLKMIKQPKMKIIASTFINGKTINVVDFHENYDK